MSKVAVGMSGGVDSALAAYILKNEGYEVIGVTFTNYRKKESDSEGAESEEVKDAAEIADFLGIRHICVDMQEEFREGVIDYFVSEYLKGRTPNPCVMCNPLVKFESLCRVMESEGCDFIATGHYAKIKKLPNSRYSVEKNTSGKDQTYALCRLTQKQLSHLLMPLAQYDKTRVREMAREAGIPVAHKKDSQDICFVEKGKYFDFIADYLEKGLAQSEAVAVRPTGNFVDEEGNVLGVHKGISHYTIGQRKKLGLALNKPVFVKEIRPMTGEVVISTEGDVYFDELECDNTVCMAEENFENGIGLIAKIRYAHEGCECTVTRIPGCDNALKVVFSEPVRAVTPGQVIVFYRDDYVYGSGIIR